MTAMANPRHRVSMAVAGAQSEIESVRDSSVWSMDREETTATLVEITRLKSQLAELEARVVEHADDVAIDTWTYQSRQTRASVRGIEKLAFALTERHHVRAALAAGDLLTEQARVIVQALDDLPADLDAEVVVEAERHLLTCAREFHARELRILGKRILEVVAPEIVEEHEAKLLEQEEQAAMAATRLTLRDNGEGSYVGTFKIPTFHGAALQKLLLGDTESRRERGPARLGRAFCELIEGKVDTTVVVTTTYESLVGDLHQAGLMETGDPISPGMARRLACEAKIRPAVLGGKSEVLDLGRSRRLHSRSQRIAIGIRDQHCTEPGCDWPPSMCHVHHDHAWANGGRTDLDNGRLLCPRHHARHHARIHRRQ